ncbi:MAG: hypothetical protein ABMB14_14605, partial [Myxococcota bacterium]
MTVLRASGLVPAAAIAVAWGLYVAGNGLVPGAVALGTVPVLLALPMARGRWAAGLGVLLVVGDVAFAATRVGAVDAYRRLGDGDPVAYCEDGRCGVRPPVYASLIREGESAAAGIALMTVVGTIRAVDNGTLADAAAAKYAALDRLRAGRPGPNALVLRSTPDRVRETIAMPPEWSPGDPPVPAVIFLHGYGGALTTYVSALRERPAFDRVAIVAPAGSFAGDWWSDDGRAVVARTLDTLPAGIDRGRVALVGLSNGAVGAVVVAADRALAARLTSVVALNGAAGPDAFGAPERLGIVAAERDQNFSLAGIREVVEALRAAGTEVTLTVVPG